MAADAASLPSQGHRTAPGGRMQTNLYQEYLAALARRSIERTDQAVACLPFLVDPLFRRRDADGPEDVLPRGHTGPVTRA